MNRKLIFKSPRFVQFGSNLPLFEADLTPQLMSSNLCYTSRQLVYYVTITCGQRLQLCGLRHRICLVTQNPLSIRIINQG